MSIRTGDFETELSLPFRVEFQVDVAGEVQITALVPLGDGFPAELVLSADALRRHERRGVQAAAERHVAHQADFAQAERAQSARESRAYWPGQV